MTCSLKTNILRFDRAVPRYTSYPTAPHFKPTTDAQSPYSAITSNDMISLYIHIPFCAQMCWYCGCHTKVTKKYDPIADYVSYLLREIDLASQSIPVRGQVGHIHFGGGTPGLLTPDDFSKIMDAIKVRFDILDTAEIAIEIDPRSLSEDRVQAYATYGVNRVSLGSQDFNDHVLSSVNRAQPYDLSLNAVTLFRKYGINNINLDLIYGLPHQNAETVIKTIDLALTLNPQRIAYFGYAHVPWMKKHMRLIDETALPDKDMRFDLFHSGAKQLEDARYIAVGIDHFVQPNDSMAQAAKDKTLKRNFQGYTIDQSNIMIGLGVSSIGKTDDYYLQNSPEMPIYKDHIDAGRLPITKTCPITDEDKLRATMIERIMCDFELNLNDYEGDYTDEINALKPYMDSGLVQINDRHIIVSAQARPIARLVAAAFDQYLPPETTQRHSKAI